MKKHRPDKKIRQMMKSIRPFVSFDYDLRKGMAGQSTAKIKKYHRELSTITRPPHIIYRPCRKDHLNIAIKKAGIEPQFKQLKAVPIATTEKSPKRYIRKGKFILEEKYTTTVFVPVDALSVVKNPKEYARKVIAENPDAETFHIKVGEHFLPTVFTKRTFTAGFQRLLNRYKGERKKNFINNVLTGFDLTTAGEQSSYMEWKAQQKRTPKKAGRKPKKIKGYGSHR